MKYVESIGVLLFNVQLKLDVSGGSMSYSETI